MEILNGENTTLTESTRIVALGELFQTLAGAPENQWAFHERRENPTARALNEFVIILKGLDLGSFFSKEAEKWKSFLSPLFNNDEINVFQSTAAFIINALQQSLQGLDYSRDYQLLEELIGTLPRELFSPLVQHELEDSPKELTKSVILRSQESILLEFFSAMVSPVKGAVSEGIDSFCRKLERLNYDPNNGGFNEGAYQAVLLPDFERHLFEALKKRGILQTEPNSTLRQTLKTAAEKMAARASEMIHKAGESHLEPAHSRAPRLDLEVAIKNLCSLEAKRTPPDTIPGETPSFEESIDNIFTELSNELYSSLQNPNEAVMLNLCLPISFISVKQWIAKIFSKGDQLTVHLEVIERTAVHIFEYISHSLLGLWKKRDIEGTLRAQIASIYNPWLDHISSAEFGSFVKEQLALAAESLLIRNTLREALRGSLAEAWSSELLRVPQDVSAAEYVAIVDLKTEGVVEESTKSEEPTHAPGLFEGGALLRGVRMAVASALVLVALSLEGDGKMKKGASDEKDGALPALTVSHDRVEIPEEAIVIGPESLVLKCRYEVTQGLEGRVRIDSCEWPENMMSRISGLLESRHFPDYSIAIGRGERPSVGFDLGSFAQLSGDRISCTAIIPKEAGDTDFIKGFCREELP